MTKAIFLDRDGVLNRFTIRDGTPRPPAGVDQLEIFPDAADSLRRLKEAGYLLIVVTNQPDVARGLVTRAAVDAIHEYMRQHLTLDEIRVCFHDDEHGCACRKPKPGMIYAAAVEREIELARSFMIGDRWRDIGAGKAAGCRTILVNAIVEKTRIEPDVELASLLAASTWILDKSGRA